MNDTREPTIAIDEIAHSVIGAAIEVHRHLGPGFLEAVYEEALEFELRSRGMRVDRQKKFYVHYKGKCVGEGFLDFLVGDLLVVELKAVKAVPPIDIARVIAYLRATDRQVALVINFNVTMLRDGIQRLVASPR